MLSAAAAALGGGDGAPAGMGQWLCRGERRPVAKLERQRGKKKPKGKLGERGAAACVKENGVGAAAGKMDGFLCCWLAKEKEMGEPTGK